MNKIVRSRIIKVVLWNWEVPDEGLQPFDRRIEGFWQKAKEDNQGKRIDSDTLIVLPPLSCRLSLPSVPHSALLSGAKEGENLFCELTEKAGSGEQSGKQLLKLLEQPLAPWRELACRLEVNLIPGSFLLQIQETQEPQEPQKSKGQGLLHLAPFIDKTGEIKDAGIQTHLTPEEAAQGWQAGRELPLVETSFGRVAILLNRDCRQPEVWRLVTLAGAELVIALSMMTKPYYESKQLAGSWQNVQQNQVLGVECSFAGRWQGKEFQARNAFFAPCEMTAGFTGFLAGIEQGDWLVKELNLTDLNQVRQEYPLLEQLNFPLYEHKLLPLYRRWQKGDRL